MTKTILALALLSLGGCAGSSHVQDCPPPKLQIEKVNLAVPVPCPALAKLGSEPAYADTDAALAAAPDIFEVTRLLLKGRLQRLQRANAYAAARVACTF